MFDLIRRYVAILNSFDCIYTGNYFEQKSIDQMNMDELMFVDLLVDSEIVDIYQNRID